MRGSRVYIVQALQLGWLKIGLAKDIARRMVEVASLVGCDLTLLGSFPGTQRDELELQRRFAHLRIAYDWFVPGEDLLACAKALPADIQISFVGSAKLNQQSVRGRLLRATHGHRGPFIHVARAPRVDVRAVTGTDDS
jgi:hypothetical protein